MIRLPDFLTLKLQHKHVNEKEFIIISLSSQVTALPQIHKKIVKYHPPRNINQEI